MPGTKSAVDYTYKDPNDWLQCVLCDKWRRLPRHIDGRDFQNIEWTCTMNPDKQRNSCSAAEESMKKNEFVPASDPNFSSSGNLRDKKLSGQKRKVLSTASEKQSESPKKKQKMSTNPTKEAELWISCDECGKLRRLIYGSQSPIGNDQWFCSMNADEDRNRCDLPEEGSDMLSRSLSPSPDRSPTGPRQKVEKKLQTDAPVEDKSSQTTFLSFEKLNCQLTEANRRVESLELAVKELFQAMFGVDFNLNDRRHPVEATVRRCAQLCKKEFGVNCKVL